MKTRSLVLAGLFSLTSVFSFAVDLTAEQITAQVQAATDTATLKALAAAHPNQAADIAKAAVRGKSAAEAAQIAADIASAAPAYAGAIAAAVVSVVGNDNAALVVASVQRAAPPEQKDAIASAVATQVGGKATSVTIQTAADKLTPAVNPDVNVSFSATR